MDKKDEKIFGAAEKRIMEDMHRDVIRLEAENLILKQILEQKLEITLIPKLHNTSGSF